MKNKPKLSLLDIDKIEIEVNRAATAESNCTLIRKDFEVRMQALAQKSPKELAQIVQENSDVKIGFGPSGRIETIKRPNDILYVRDPDLKGLIHELGTEKEKLCRKRSR